MIGWQPMILEIFNFKNCSFLNRSKRYSVANAVTVTGRNGNRFSAQEPKKKLGWEPGINC